MPAFQLHRSKLAYPTLAVAAALTGLFVVAHGANAQSATGTVSGRVLWGACIRGIPLPMMPNGQPQTGATSPGAAGPPDAQIVPGMPVQPPTQINGLPAGAVLVAVQNTSISARTDEAGKFTLSGVPAGQYLTVAAGPVADSVSATAERPNVFVSGGQSVDVGTLSLGGGSTPFPIACRMPLGVNGSATAADAAPADAAPTDAPPPTVP